MNKNYEATTLGMLMAIADQLARIADALENVADKSENTATYQGVRDGTAMALSVHEDDVLEAITAGTDKAFPIMLREEMIDAVKDGTHKALDLVFGEQILGAITDGTKEALNHR